MIQTPTAGPLLVVLVEDEVDLAEVTQATLEHRGLNVAVAHDGLQGLDLIDKLQPQVIVTDLVMPVLDGLELIRRHAARPHPRAPVIAVSAMGARLRAARDLGAAQVLLKPVPPEELVRSVLKAALGEW
jgi:CheY-like chemotaxis protein